MLCSSCMRARAARFGTSTAVPSGRQNNLPRLRQQPLSTAVRSPPSSIPFRSSSLGNIAAIPRPRNPHTTLASAFRRVACRSYSSQSSSPAAGESPTPSGRLEKPDFLDDAESVIWDRLEAEFAPTELLVQDISGGCGSMYGIEIASEKFRGANMLKQQRMVNAVLGDLMKGWHGVQLKTRVP